MKEFKSSLKQLCNNSTSLMKKELALSNAIEPILFIWKIVVRTRKIIY